MEILYRSLWWVIPFLAGLLSGCLTRVRYRWLIGVPVAPVILWGVSISDSEVASPIWGLLIVPFIVGWTAAVLAGRWIRQRRLST